MDDRVVAAMSRWPDVPAVFGWLSLSRLGQWRIHAEGNGMPDNPHAQDLHLTEGEAIANPQILQFINRNYGSDQNGRWYFQNGPQRVFVRLDAAPYILHTTGADTALQTHNGLPVRHVTGWWLDSEGKLYAMTEHGPALIAGRDTMAVFEALHTFDGLALLDLLDSATKQHPLMIAPLDTDSGADPAPMHFCPAAQIPLHMGFTRFPTPDSNELVIK